MRSQPKCYAIVVDLLSVKTEVLRIEILILSRMCLLTFPRFDLVGFMSLHLGLVAKFGLWSFKVINDGFFGNCSMRLSNLRFFASCFASKLICLTMFSLDYIYTFIYFSRFFSVSPDQTLLLHVCFFTFSIS